MNEDQAFAFKDRYPYKTYKSNAPERYNALRSIVFIRLWS